jgi:hypothetical protein
LLNCCERTGRGKAVAVRGREGTFGCKMSRLPHFQTIGSQKVVTSALIDSRATVKLEDLGQLKNPMTASGIEPATLSLVA